MRGTSCICVRRGTRPPISTASRQSPSRSAVSSTRHYVAAVWCGQILRPPPDGSMHPHCEPYPANDKRYLNSVLTKKTASATHRTIQPSIRPDLNTICSSPKIEMGGKIFLDCTPIVGLKKFRFDDRRCGSFLGLSRFDCPLAKTGGTVNGGA